jgi:ATP-dependent Clp protease ATP-binding subunit ClpA
MEAQILKENLDSCIKYGFLKEEDIVAINNILINRLEENPAKNQLKFKLNPDDIERDLGESCESGACPTR